MIVVLGPGPELSPLLLWRQSREAKGNDDIGIVNNHLDIIQW